MKSLLLVCLVSLLAMAGCSAVNVGGNGEVSAQDASGKKAPKLVTKAAATFNTTSPDGYENDDSVGTAKAFRVYKGAASSKQQHNFFDDAVDYYYFDAAPGKKYVIETTVYGPADTIIEAVLTNVYAPTSSPGYFANDDKGDGSWGSKVEASSPSQGPVLFVVKSYNGLVGADRGYEITISNTAGSDGYEDDDTMDKANPLNLGEWDVTYNLGTGYDNGSPASVQYHDFEDDSIDWVKAYLTQGKTYTFRTGWCTIGGSGASGYIDPRAYMTLYDGKNIVASGRDKGCNYDQIITYTAPTTGWYFLKMTDVKKGLRGYYVSFTQN